MMTEFMKQRTQELVSPRGIFVELTKHLITVGLAIDAGSFQVESLLLNSFLAQGDPEVLIPGADMNDPARMITEYSRISRSQNDTV